MKALSSLFYFFSFFFFSLTFAQQSIRPCPSIPKRTFINITNPNYLPYSAIGSFISEEKSFHFCSLIRISPDYAITAAHCVANYFWTDKVEKPKLRVLFGLYAHKSAYEPFRVKKIMIPKEYYVRSIDPVTNLENEITVGTTTDNNYDFSLIKIDEPPQGNTGFVALQSHDFFIHQAVESMGYPHDAGNQSSNGFLWSSKGVIINVMNKKNTRLFDFDACITHGNSGGPVFVKNHKDEYSIIGIVTRLGHGFNSAIRLDSEILERLESWKVDGKNEKTLEFNF